MKLKKKQNHGQQKMLWNRFYEMNLWGGNNPGFYSGIGSHHPEIVHPYIDVVTTFLTSFKNPLVVCDLGCGDFNVGKKIGKAYQKVCCGRYSNRSYSV